MDRSGPGKVMCCFPRIREHVRRLLRLKGDANSLPPELADIVPARGYLEDLVCGPQELAIEGWLLHPEKPITTLRLYLNGEAIGAMPIQPRTDLPAMFPWIPHVDQTGIDVRLSNVRAKAGRIDMVGCQGDRPLVRMATLYRHDLESSVPTPPDDLMFRVAHIRDGRSFKVWGLKCYGDFLDFIRRHCPRRPRRLLDWGCGCGRLTAHFLADPSGPETFGCDVDAEAVAWCNDNLRTGRFTTIAPYPPTPYPDASFDLILAYSVFTHLRREVQDAWLAELRRLLVPGGVLMATVHGESATSFAFPGQVQQVLQDGFFDGVDDGTLGDIVPAGYYRGSFQTQSYTEREWAHSFDILQYSVRGIGNHQDAVVMRRRP